jgi:hypothetical protein
MKNSGEPEISAGEHPVPVELALLSLPRTNPCDGARLFRGEENAIEWP